MEDATTGFPGNPEMLLQEEIAFWRDYISYCRARDNGSVPQRAYDALELAKLKLSLVHATQNDQDSLNKILH